MRPGVRVLGLVGPRLGRSDSGQGVPQRHRSGPERSNLHVCGTTPGIISSVRWRGLTTGARRPVDELNPLDRKLDPAQRPVNFCKKSLNNAPTSLSNAPNAP